MSDKEELTKEELETLAQLLANAQVRVQDAPGAMQLLEKLKRMIAQTE